jgi:imidazolonepropionase-like amidohydrolase
MRRLSFVLMLGAFSWAPAASPSAAATQQTMAITNASTVDPVAAITRPGQTVIVTGGRIERFGPAADVSIPADATTVDLKSAFLMPGLISAHVHISDVQGVRDRAYTDENTLRQLGVFARYGITSVLSLGGELPPAFTAREGQRAGALNRARIAVSGDVLNPSTPEQARSEVARMAALRVDWIKIRVDDNLGTSAKMPPAVFTAVIEEAHARNLKVAAHIYYLDDAKALLKAGVDMIAHSVRDREIDEEFVALMKARSVPYCPTLTRELSTFVYESTPEFFSDVFFTREADPAVVARLREPARQEAMRTAKAAQTYKAQLPVAMKNLKRAADAGVLIVMGTDSGPFPERFQGYFEHLELAMMADAGLTPAQILRSATTDAARGAGLRDVGAITMGRWADLVAFERNPLDDVRNSTTLTSVWIAGVAIRR